MYTGKEKIHIGRKELPYTMLKFWQLSLSDILFSMNRGTFAEFIVRCSLDLNGCDSLSEENGTIRPYDVTGPMIPGTGRRSHLEVKSTASIQSDTPIELEPFQKPDTKLQFGIKPTIEPGHEENGPQRNNDLYVFCHYKAVRHEDDILDLDLWDFYVYPTFKIDEDPILKDQTSISLYRLKKLSVQPQSFESLYQEIVRVLSEISAHMTHDS